MSHIDPGPLATYESLADPHLTGYFNNSRMRRHLRKMGLITSRGNIVSEKVFRLNNARKEHQRHIRDVLAQAIIHKALDMERHRQMHIKKQLEDIGKIERVRRVRSERSLRGDEDLLPLLSPRMKHSKDKKHGRKSKSREKVPILQTVTDSDDYQQQPPQSVGYPAIPSDTPYNTRTDRMKTQYPEVEVDNQHLYELDRDALRSFTLNLSQFDLGSGVSPYSVPPLEKTVKKKERRRPATATGASARVSIKAPRPRSNARSLKLHRREPPMMHRAQLHTLARVTFKYLGQMVHLDHEEEDPRDEVVVMQQHCGGENLRIFKGMLMKGDRFVVISRRHRTFPFSLTFYLNGVQVERLSTCCEYKHKLGHKLGAKSSHFGIVKVDGSQACFKCLIAQGKLKTRPDPTPPPTGKPSKPTRTKRRPAKRLHGVDEQKPEEYADDFQTSSKSSTSEDVQTDGPKMASDESSSELSDTESESTISDVSDSENEDANQRSESESRLSSKPGEDDSYSSDSSSEDSQKRSKQTKKTMKKSPPPAKTSKSPTPAKQDPPPQRKHVRSPVEKERATSPIEKTRTPSPVQNVTKSEQPSIQKVNKSPPPSSTSGKDDVGGTSASESLSSMSSTDSGDTVEEAIKPETGKTKEPQRKTPDGNKNNNNSSEIKTGTDEKPSTTDDHLNGTEPVDVQRSKTPVPASESSSSSDSDSSEAESFKSKSSDDEKGSKDADQKEKINASILPLVRGKVAADLSGKQITKYQIEELTEFLDKDPSALGIQQMSLKGCDVGNEGGKAILKSLLKAKSLKSLDMSGNNITQDSVELLLDVCQKNPVDHLSVANNPLGDHGCEELISGFTRSQANVVTAQIQKRVSQSLISSVLKDSRKELGDESGAGMSSSSSMSSLASTAVTETVFLQDLDISNTKAGHGTFVSLGSYLALNPKVTTLNLSGNSISTTALESLINSLGDGSNKNLRILRMNSTTMDNRHAELIAEKLTDKCRLLELSVKGNRITKEGIEKLEEYKRKNNSLETLILE
uniref:glutamate-rich protein 3-like n=1 Tax=Styela clava TaxID=7725 RepID=UPI001939D71D|nr:glutamate-rich protein 3-like [Styela clava]